MKICKSKTNNCTKCSLKAQLTICVRFFQVNHECNVTFVHQISVSCSPNRCLDYSWTVLLRHHQSCMLQRSTSSAASCVSCFSLFSCQISFPVLENYKSASDSPAHGPGFLLPGPHLEGVTLDQPLIWARAEPIRPGATLGWLEVSKQSASLETNSIDEQQAV